MVVRCLNHAEGKRWIAYHGDCVDVLRQLPNSCVDFSIFSPPFSGLYIYNDSIADMGNSANDKEFFEHYRFFVSELFRVLRPGRCVDVHCKDLVYYQNACGTSGLRDFPGDLIRAHIAAGFDYHSRVTVHRCPVREMTKTKARGLLYKQLRSDSTFSRAGLPEYILTFRKWAGEDDGISPVTHTEADFPLPQWRIWADPVWMDTRETDCLNAKREPADEKHICPLPLDLITRCVLMRSNPGDVVLSPFMGIGSEGYVALRQGRKFVGIELKKSYWGQSCKYFVEVESQSDLFAAAPDSVSAVA